MVGAFAWMRGAERAAFDARDLTLAEEVARRAAMAVEHAQLYRQAQSASRMKDEFVATLSHELRTPLNALLGWIELLRSGRLSHDRQREAVEAIHRTAAAQAQLTNDLVDVSRAVSGKFKLEPREVHVGQLVPATIDVFRLAAESKGLWLRCQVDEPLPRLVADPDRLQQIVYNLVGNAVKFTARGGVDVGARLDTDWVELTVRDTGIGIDPEFLPYVFDRFRQADGRVTREFGGLGLGLSIVRALVELHGGTVAAASDGLGHGAMFTVRLPLAPPAQRRTADAVAHLGPSA
jgi:signal transduction histidine kinase